MLDERRELLRRRVDAVKAASTSLISFARLMKPVPTEVQDPDKSLYIDTPHHRFIADKLEQVASGEIKRLIINCPPRAGKSELASKLFPAFYAGKYPDRSLILATYNERFSYDFGRAVRHFMRSAAYKQVFPNTIIKTGAAAANRIETVDGGLLVFTGVGGSITGRGGHVLLIDDPIKDRQQADSAIERDKAWVWFQQVFRTRAMDETGAIVIVTTRWSPDDIVGRLTDDTNSYYDEEEAAKWEIIDLPALALEDDPLGRQPGEPLWPERFGRDYLESLRRSDPRGFSALYQCRPAPEDGVQFKAEWIKTYKPKELPENLRFYVAVDFAVSGESTRDKTCIMPVGVDENGEIWVLPDVWWKAGPADVVVEAFINVIEKREPLMVWGEKGQIAKSLGPFIRRRMQERRVYATIDETHPTADKVARAQAISGRMANGLVHFPIYAPWWAAARDQLLKFPQSTHDDFVDALSLIGLGLMKLSTPRGIRAAGGPKPGTFGYLKEQTKVQRRAIALAEGADGW